MLFLFSTALAVASVFLPTTNAMVCNNTLNGVTYDLTPLQGIDYKISPSVGSYDYYINVCGAVQGPCASHPDAFACQVRKSPINQFESVLAYSNIQNHTSEPIWEPSTSPTGGVKLVLTNGDPCNLGQRILNVDFQCDETGSRSITADEDPSCTFNIMFPTKVVCPGYVPPPTLAPTTEAPTTAAPTTAAPTTKAPTTRAPTTATPTPTPTVIPTHVPTSTPTSSPSSSDDITITRAGISIGIGIGVGIGVGCMAISWLIWCCWDRYRTQQQVQMGNGYTPLTSSI